MKRVVAIIVVMVLLLVVMSDKKIINPQEHTRYDGQIIFKKTTPQGDIYNDTVVDRILTGYQKDGFGTGKNIGMKVSKEGVDVKTATNDQLIFNSSQNMFKIAQSGTVIIPSKTLPNFGDTGYTSVVVTHNLGYKPVVMAYINDIYGNLTAIPAFRYYQGFQALVLTGGGTYGYVMPLNQYMVFGSDTNTVTFYDYFINPNPGGAAYTTGDISVKYYLLQETAN